MTTPIEGKHTYTVTISFNSNRPYTKAELEKLSNWWLFVMDRQTKVTAAKVTGKEKKT